MTYEDAIGFTIVLVPFLALVIAEVVSLVRK